MEEHQGLTVLLTGNVTWIDPKKLKQSAIEDYD